MNLLAGVKKILSNGFSDGSNGSKIQALAPSPAHVNYPQVKSRNTITSLQETIPAMFQAFQSAGYMQTPNWYQLANMYTSWVYTAIEKEAITLASLPGKLFRYEHKVSGKSLKPWYVKSMLAAHNGAIWGGHEQYEKAMRQSNVKRVELDDHPVLDLLAKPNPFQVRSNFWRLLAIHLGLDGSVAVYKAKKFLGNPLEIYILPQTWTGNFKPIPGTDGRTVIEAYMLQDQNINERFETDEIIWLKYDHLRSPYEGMSALKAQLYSFNLDQYLMQSMSAFYRYGAMFSNTFKTTGGEVLTEEQVTQITESLQKFTGPSRAGQPFFANGIEPTKTINATPAEAMIDKIEELARDKMLSAHDTSAAKVGLAAQHNRANLEAVDIGYYNERIKPRAMLICEYFNQFLVCDYDPLLDFQFDYPHFIDEKLELDRRESNLKNGVVTINETRAEMGLEAVEWGDKPALPMNIAPYDGKEEALLPAAALAAKPKPGTAPDEESAPDAGPDENDIEEPSGASGKALPAVRARLKILPAYWTKARKDAEWKAFSRFSKSNEKLFTKPVNKWLESMKAACIDALQSKGALVKIEIVNVFQKNRAEWLHKDGGAKITRLLPDKAEFKAALKKAIKPAFVSVLDAAGKKRIEALGGGGKALPVMQVKAGDGAEGDEEAADTITGTDFAIEFNVNDSKLKKWLGSRLETFSENVTQNQIDAVKKILSEDYEAGAPLATITEHIRDYFDGDQIYRGKLIARTEVTAATGQADLSAIDQMGLSDEMVKIWVAEHNNTRDTHLQAEDDYSEGIAMDEDFQVGGDTMDAPGNGSDPAEVCNCQCLLVFAQSKES